VIGLARAEPRERFEQFKEPPPGFVEEERVRGHLLSTSGSNRWQVWTTAVDQFRTEPVRGQGAGSFEAWWLQHPESVGFMRDAHSLYLETLGELGVVGIALLLVAFASALASSLRPVRGAQPRDRLLLAALVASALSFLVAAGIDWFWESTALAVAVFAALGLLARSNRRGSRRATRSRTAVRLAAAAGALVVLLACGLIFAGQLELQRSEREAAEGRPTDATKAARRASALAPWSAAPHLQLALLREEAGDVAGAEASIGAALERDPSAWTLWAVAARLHASRGAVADARAALARARQLNPRAGILVQK
jgi:O-antigen ligase